MIFISLTAVSSDNMMEELNEHQLRLISRELFKDVEKFQKENFKINMKNSLILKKAIQGENSC